MHITITVRDFPRFEKKVAQINKKAIALGYDAIAVTDVSESFESVDGRYRKVHAVTIKAPEVFVRPGWEVVGLVESIKNSDKKIVTGLGTELSASWESHNMCCDHCGTKRARKQVFLVQSGDQLLSVGKQCLEGYTGINPEMVLALSQLWTAPDDFPTARVQSFVSVLDVITAALTAIRIDGFTSKKGAQFSDRRPTFIRVAEIIDGFSGYRNQEERDAMLSAYQISEEDEQQALAINNEWLAYDGQEAFLTNLKNFAQAGIVEDKFLSHIVAGTGTAIATPKPATPKPKMAGFVGTVGQRTTCRAKAIALRQYESYYGQGWMVIFQTEDNQKLTWFTSSAIGDFMNFQGEASQVWQDISFAVKDHQQDPKYGDTTIVTRLKALAPC